MSEWQEMKLNDVLKLDSFTLLRRVPGGWVINVNSENGEAITFIPFNTEFQIEPPKD
jgi:hypothetical protein